MKRYSGLHDKLCTIENIEVADDKQDEFSIDYIDKEYRFHKKI